MHSPLILHASPAASFDEPFEMLLACHGRVRHMLGLLLRLHAHLQAQGAADQTRDAARDVMRYFDIAGPAHHEDEERHLFPRLLARGEQLDVVRQLQADHLEMARQWAQVRADLQAVAASQAPDLAACAARWAGFAALYQDHIRAEEDLAYPAARALFDADALHAAGVEMAARRGLVRDAVRPAH